MNHFPQSQHEVEQMIKNSHHIILSDQKMSEQQLA